MRIGVIGTGRVGLVSAVCLAQIGHQVYCIDSDHDRIQMLNNGSCPFFEPTLPALLSENKNKGTLFFSSSIGEFINDLEVLFLAPEASSSLYTLAEEIGALLEHQLVVALKSSLPVGTAEEIEKIISRKVQERGVVLDIHVASNPGFLQAGTAVADFMSPARLIVGVNNADEGRIFQNIYYPLTSQGKNELLLTSVRTAEFAPFAASAAIASRLCLDNELARLANIVGADSELLCQFPRYGGSYLTQNIAGINALVEEHELDLPLLKAISNSNSRHEYFTAKKIIDHFNGNLRNLKIAVLGLACKPGTDEVDASPAMAIIDRLLGKGAQVYAHDPLCVAYFRRSYGERNNLTYLEMLGIDLQEMDAIAVVTAWDSYKNIDWSSYRNGAKDQCIFDLNSQFDKAQLKSYGYKYQN
jgi:UDPglucose 6-dehydrogenase